MRAFPTMLKGLVQDYYYNTQLSKYIYVNAYNRIRNFFEGPEYQYSNLNKWNSITLDSLAAKHLDKSTWELV